MSLKERTQRLLADPRLLAWIEREDVARGLVAILEAPGRIGRRSVAETDRLARALGLATAAEVRSLRLRVEALEGERRGRP